MSEEETLGKLAYEAYCKAKNVEPLAPFENSGVRWKQAWIAAAKAVAERILQRGTGSSRRKRLGD